MAHIADLPHRAKFHPASSIQHPAQGPGPRRKAQRRGRHFRSARLGPAIGSDPAAQIAPQIATPEPCRRNDAPPRSRLCRSPSAWTSRARRAPCGMRWPAAQECRPVDRRGCSRGLGPVSHHLAPRRRRRGHALCSAAGVRGAGAAGPLRCARQGAPFMGCGASLDAQGGSWRVGGRDRGIRTGAHGHAAVAADRAGALAFRMNGGACCLASGRRRSRPWRCATCCMRGAL